MTERLTKTQRIILRAAAKSPAGTVLFGAGDRCGTRVVGYDSLERPLVIAYGQPYYFLVAPGMLEPANERGVFRVTEKGRSAVGPIHG